MHRDPNGTDYRSNDAAKRLRRLRQRAQAKPIRLSAATNNALASFGMIVSLLVAWAMAVNM